MGWLRGNETAGCQLALATLPDAFKSEPNFLKGFSMTQTHSFRFDGHRFEVEMQVGRWYRESKDRTPGGRNHWPLGDGNQPLTEADLLARLKGWIKDPHHRPQP